MKCIFCGSKTHTYRNCTLTYTMQRRKELNAAFKQEYVGKSPNVFVGKWGYPRVRVGILGVENYEKNDEPATWAKENTSIPKIVGLRSALVNSYFTQSIRSFTGKMMGLTKDISLAKRPVDMEVSLQKKPTFKLTLNRHLLPHGPTVKVKGAEITENLPIDTKVEKAVDATDLKATDAVTSLVQRGVDPYYVTKVFSTGNFGIPSERKLVPTRWSITAVDDIQGKQLIKKIKEFGESDCVVHFGGHYGNYYLVLFFDDLWQFELFEQWWPSQRTSLAKAETDYEPYTGRTRYVEETAGGYYATRLGVLEHLSKLKRQSATLVIRIITDEYTVPLGVWVVREAVRKALKSPPLRFADRRLMLEYCERFLKQKFGYDAKLVLDRSILKKALFGQRKLTSY